jgi:hypothetical protein
MNAVPAFARRLALLAALACAGAFFAAPAGADVIRLKTGETIKGRILHDRTNEAVLVIEDYLSGGVREIAWDAVSQEDAELHDPSQAGGMKKELVVQCEIVTYRLDGGSTAEVRGVVKGEEGGFLLVKTTQKEPLRIEKTRIVSREQSECAPEDVEEPVVLYEQKKAEIDPQDARGWYRLAVYAEKVGWFEGAKEAYETAASDETYLQRAAAQAGAARVSALIRDKAALATLADLRNKLAFTQFAGVRAGLEAFPTQHPEASDAVKKQVEALRAALTEKRGAYFKGKVFKDFTDVLKNLIQKKVTGKNVLYNDVQGWARKPAVDAAFEEVTKRYQAKDATVTPEEVNKQFWEGRPKPANGWKRAKYGSGSFLIEPPKIKPPSGGNRPPQPRSGGSGGQPAPKVDHPKPPTRDEWWAKASTEERTQFWLATIVEKSGLFELAQQRERTACPLCLGEGLIHRVTSGGADDTYLCNRCGGAQNDLTVKFR